MTAFRPPVLRILLVLALLALGAGLCALLVPGEIEVVRTQLADFPDADLRSNMARPWIVAGLCLLPAVAGAAYAAGTMLDRYVARQFGVIFFICFTTLFMIWLLVDLSDNLSDFRVNAHPLRAAAGFYLARSPSTVVLLLPYALLLASIYALGKLSRDRELVAMVQSGRGVARITLPLVVAGLLCSLLCVGLNYHWAPVAEGSRNEILARVRGIEPSANAESYVVFVNKADHRLWLVGEFPPNYQRGEPLRLVEVTTTRPDGRLVSRLTARTATWRRSDNAWIFEEPVLCTFADGEPPVFEKSAEPLVRTGWTETPWELIRPGLAAGYLGVPDLNSWLNIQGRREDFRAAPVAAAPYRTQWHYRWALPFGCLVTVLLAVPLSVHFSRRSHGGAVVIAVALSAVMLMSANIVLNFGESGMIPPAVAAWLPNMSFALLAWALYRGRARGWKLIRPRGAAAPS